MSSGSTSCPRRPSPRRSRPSPPRCPRSGPYCSAARGRVGGDAATSARRALGREGRRVGQPAGERDHLGALGDRHQVAHRRGRHDRACARRTGRRSARGRAALAQCGRRSPLGSAPCRLSSCAAHRTATDATSSSTFCQGMGSPLRRASAPSCPRSLAGALATADVGRRLRRHALRVPESPVFLLAVAVALVAARAARSAVEARAAGRGGARPASASASARCCSRARSPTTTPPGGRASSPASPAAALAQLAARAACSRRRPRAPRRRGRARALPVYVEAAALVARRPLDPRPAARPRSPLGFFVWLLRGGAPPRGREVRGPAHPAVSTPAQARPRRHRRHEAGDARARGRDRPGARAAARRSSAGASSTTAPPRSPRSRRSARRRSPPAPARTDHQIPSMNWYSRAEERYVEYGSSFSRARALRRRPSSPTRSTT